MKKLSLLVLVLVFIMTTPVIAKDFKAQKFKTIFTVQFNAITLEEAARLETVFKKKFSDACTIDVTAEATDSDLLTFTTGSITTGVWVEDDSDIVTFN